MKQKSIFVISLLSLFVTVNTSAKDIVIGLGGNAYLTQSGADRDRARITDRGIEQWNGEEDVISVYFYVEEPQMLDLAVNAAGNSTIKISDASKSYSVKLKSDDFLIVPVGKIQVSSAGYVCVTIQGKSKKGNTFGNVKELILKNPKGKITYVHDFSNYWGRRGPSVHMKYMLPKDTIEWFYNELTVPASGEIMGSYYMSNGFGEGYFGIQYNSARERRVLFSVWSPFQTDDPKSIPADQQIKILRKGEDVHIGEFGNEGSGGQSYMRYNWTAGTTYKFLTQVRPDGNGNTIYTAYFYAADEGQWRLIAGFLRPQTNTWYRGAHSFLENFMTNQGYLSRSVEFGNQWVLDKNGQWHELTEAVFTYDATARAGVRIDYQGGLLENNRFYLKNGGFFQDNTDYRSTFNREPSGKQPDIDIKMLENL